MVNETYREIWLLNELIKIWTFYYDDGTFERLTMREVVPK